jgi:hypothetical protein
MFESVNTTLIFWGAIALISIVSIIFRFMEQSSRNKTLRILAEKGHTIPPEIFTSNPVSYHRTANSFRAGIILMSIGIGTAIFFYAMTGGGGFDGPIHGVSWLPAIGVIPLMIGFALFLIAILERRMPPPPEKP